MRVYLGKKGEKNRSRDDKSETETNLLWGIRPLAKVPNKGNSEVIERKN